ncbi:MAG: hypothetical protein MK211_01195 [Flavobacteriales bacterium]|jgi:hypothetical protein|uniref:hypothetical protein n=1 Tax=Candidatus Ulvibacter alkanivorans TaxID=2267620 RepID=UPI00109D6A9B|nr:hypothetical protein [Candidatus Ulvibacter alkanivorans]MCH2488738.1 hypothetical protein [Flavobacteriales bacterium]
MSTLVKLVLAAVFNLLGSDVPQQVENVTTFEIRHCSDDHTAQRYLINTDLKSFIITRDMLSQQQ